MRWLIELIIPGRPAGQRVQHVTARLNLPVRRLSHYNEDVLEPREWPWLRRLSVRDIAHHQPAPPYPARAADGSAHSFPGAAEPGGILWRAQRNPPRPDPD